MFNVKRLLGPLLICLVVFPLAPTAESQVGSIIVTSDIGASDCAFVDTAPALQPAYVFHMLYPAGSIGSRFRLNVEELGWIYLGDVSQFAVLLGQSIDGITICYAACLTGTLHILTANFFGQGLAPTCARLTVEAHPDGGVEALDCDGNVGYALAGEAVVNPDAGCYCTACRVGTETACAKKVGPSDATPSNFCATVPVHQSTWGAIKTLYR